MISPDGPWYMVEHSTSHCRPTPHSSSALFSPSPPCATLASGPPWMPPFPGVMRPCPYSALVCLPALGASLSSMNWVNASLIVKSDSVSSPGIGSSVMKVVSFFSFFSNSSFLGNFLKASFQILKISAGHLPSRTPPLAGTQWQQAQERTALVAISANLKSPSTNVMTIFCPGMRTALRILRNWIISSHFI